MYIDISKLFFDLPPLLKRHKLAQLLLLISPESCIQLVQFNETARLYADISDEEARNCLITRTFEPEFFSIAKPFLAKGGIFFDIGANFGFCSFGTIECFSNKTNIDYHLFEANSTICELLFKSAALYPTQRLIINNCCVTDKPGISKLKVFKRRRGQSFISNDGQQEVSNLVLDDYIQKNSIEQINFLKIDIEGWEPFALKGAIASLEQGIVNVVYMETISAHLLRVGLDVIYLLKILQDTGFQLFYCKANDFKEGTADEKRAFTLEIHGYPLKLASLDFDNLPSHFHTDLLAIHKTTNFL
jgi:FkbM family methyltransferase